MSGLIAPGARRRNVANRAACVGYIFLTELHLSHAVRNSIKRLRIWHAASRAAPLAIDWDCSLGR